MLLTAPNLATVATLEGAPAGLTLTARIVDGDETLTITVTVVPKLDSTGDPLDAYMGSFIAPASLPVMIEWLDGATVVGREVVVDGAAVPVPATVSGLVEIAVSVTRVGPEPQKALFAVDGADVFVQGADGSAAIIWADSAGSVALSSPLVSDNGRVTGWVPAGQHLRSKAVLPGVLDPAAPWEYFHSSGPPGPAGPAGPDTEEAIEGLAVKPLTGIGIPIQFVDAAAADDSGDGLSWGTAKKTIGAAVTVSSPGAAIYVMAGQYNPPATITLDGHRVIGQPRSLVAGTVRINHAFNGNLFTIATSAKLTDLMLWNMAGGWTGAAIGATAGVNTALGYIYGERINVSGDAAWQRDLDLDGSLNATGGAPGIRSVFFEHSQFFGASTVGETIRLNRVVHAFFTACEVIQAPAVGIVGVKILHADSSDIHWAACTILGDFVSEAAGGVTFMGRISGALTFAAGSDNNQFWGIVPSPTNNGGTGNQVGQSGNLFRRGTGFNSAIGGNSDTSRLKLSGIVPGSAGVVEVFDCLSVSANHAFDAFPSAGPGAAYLDAGLLTAERADPAAPAADQARLYARDNGAGKTQICVRFATGAIQVVATEP